MKKTLLAAFSIFTLGISAHAAAEKVRSVNSKDQKTAQDLLQLLNGSDEARGLGKSKFQIVLDLARQGAPVAFDEVEGLHLGRCFNFIKDNAARNAALTVLEVDAEPNSDIKNGPLFPVEKVKTLWLGLYKCDARCMEQRSKDLIVDELRTWETDFSLLSESPLSVVIKSSTLMSITKNGPYLFAHTTTLREGQFMGSDGEIITVGKGYPTAACYFFKKK